MVSSPKRGGFIPHNSGHKVTRVGFKGRFIPHLGVVLCPGPNFPLPEMCDPHGGRFRPKVGYGGYFKPRGGGVALPLSAVHGGTSEEFFRWAEGHRSHPPTTQVESEGAAQGLGLRPAWGWYERTPHAGMTAAQRWSDGGTWGGYKGALQGLGLWLAQGGGAKRRGAASSRPH